MLKPSADGLVAVFTQVLRPRPAATAAVQDPPSRQGKGERELPEKDFNENKKTIYKIS